MNDLIMGDELLERSKDSLRLRLDDGFLRFGPREAADRGHGFPQANDDKFDGPIKRAAEKISAAVPFDLA
jgi:hypothetical protein